MKTVLCLLTYNERECLELMLPKLPKPSVEEGFDEVVAVDGGSTDGTLEVYKAHGIQVVGQSRRGRGEAFHVAFRSVEADAYIFFSPDGNEDPSDIKKFKPLLEAGNDLVIASRMMPGAVNEEDHLVLKWRKWANNAFNLLANLFFRKSGPYITDSINGFRAITRSAAIAWGLDAQDYTIEYQMTIRALHAGARIAEFPTHEGQRLAGETGASSIPTGLRFLKRLWIEFKRAYL